MAKDASADRRLFGPRDGGAQAYVTSTLGVVRVELGPDRIGEFSLCERCRAQAVGAADALVAVGTDEGVLVDQGAGFEQVGFGPAVAVGVADGSVLAADPDGTVAAWRPDGAWRPLGSVSGPRRFDGRLLAADDGLYRATEEFGRLRESAAVDVAADGPTVATETGIFRHEDGGWVQTHDEAVSVVTATHAVGASGLLERTDDGWRAAASGPPAQPVDLVSGACLYAVTTDGEFLVSVPDDQATDGQGGWRSRTLGVRGVTALAVRG